MSDYEDKDPYENITPEELEAMNNYFMEKKARHKHNIECGKALDGIPDPAAYRKQADQALCAWKLVKIMAALADKGEGTSGGVAQHITVLHWFLLEPGEIICAARKIDSAEIREILKQYGQMEEPK